MSDFRAEFDARLPALTAAIDNMSGDLEQFSPGFSRTRLKRIFQRISVALGRLDKKGAKHPEFLAFGGQPLPSALNSTVDAAISHMASGAGTFVGNSFPNIITMLDQLERALGAEPDQVRRLNSTITADLVAAVERSDDLLNRISTNSEQIDEAVTSAKDLKNTLGALVEGIQNDASKASEARRSLEQLVNPDGRSKVSLETLARRARERITEIDDASGQIQTVKDEAGASAGAIGDAKIAAEATLSELRKLRDEAEQILNLSSQAGLAASYKIESDRLDKRANIFTYILYGTAAVTLAVAALWVLPELENAVDRDGMPGDIWKGISLTLLRASVLAPLVYVLYFTTKRISELETLRMDYAEKAAASLSYSGYREQMNSDDDLLRQLKGSLLIKFAEHPERLLRPQATTTTARVTTPGFEAETSVNASARPASEQEK